MIQKTQFKLKLTVSEYRRLAQSKPWVGKWDDDSLSDIKSKIRSQLVSFQRVCAYCGLPFKGAKDKQIEHIAPKAKFRQPEFTFTLHNLVLACGYCNDLIVKGSKATVHLPAHRCYRKCSFSIVHPYFDDPDEYFQWTDKILIQVKDQKEKGRNSIEMFSLDSEEMTEWRAAFSLLETSRQTQPLSSADEKTIARIQVYKQSS